ncbi:MAG: ABC-2 family transporter protein [Candidatus Wallbacteria bacterium]|nr:ABC-2 family transporter protein [Candidatus Wallbacteria bacterium]
MHAAGNFLLSGIDFCTLWALFNRFGTIRGWTLAEVALLYGMVNLSFALAEALARGFGTFETLVRHGGFDRMLLRPRSTALQVAGQEVQLMRVGRFFQGGGVLLWAAASLDVRWTAAKVTLTAAAIIGGACLFAGLFVLQATLTFFTTSTLEIVNTVTYGGVETAQYPLSVYRPWFRGFFTFVVPLACVNYLPAHALLERNDPLGSPSWLRWAAPLAGVLFLTVALRIWELGVRHYRSTGS